MAGRDPDRIAGRQHHLVQRLGRHIGKSTGPPRTCSTPSDPSAASRSLPSDRGRQKSIPRTSGVDQPQPATAAGSDSPIVGKAEVVSSDVRAASHAAPTGRLVLIDVEYPHDGNRPGSALVRSYCAENDEPPVELGFRGLGVVCSGYWQGEGDGASRSSKASALGVGGLGEHGHGGVGAGEADVVAGEGGQVGEQALVAVGGQVAVGGGFAGGFGGGARWSGVRVRRDCRFGWVFVGEGQRGQGFTQVPGEVGGEHADQHVGADAVFAVVVDGA